MSAAGRRLWTRDYIMVMISNFTASFSYTSFITILAVYVNARGGSNMIAGAMTAAMTIAMMISRPIIGNLIDITGRRPMIRLGGILFALNTFAYLLPLSIPALFVVRTLHGISQSMYCVSTQTMVADVVPEERLVDGVGYFSVSSSLSGAVGPMIGLWVYQAFGAQALFAMMSISAAIGGVCALLIRTDFKPERLPSQQLPRTASGLVKSLVELSALVPGLVMFFVMMGYSSASSFLSTCAVERNIGNISIYFTLASCGMVLTRLFAGKVTDRIGFTIPLAVGTVTVAVSFLLLAFAHTIPLVAISGVLYGLGGGMVQPLLNVLIFRFAGPTRRGAALATFGVLSDMGTGIGSAIWGITTISLGYTTTFLFAALCPFVSLALHILILRSRIHSMKPLY